MMIVMALNLDYYKKFLKKMDFDPMFLMISAMASLTIGLAILLKLISGEIFLK